MKKSNIVNKTSSTNKSIFFFLKEKESDKLWKPGYFYIANLLPKMAISKT